MSDEEQTEVTDGAGEEAVEQWTSEPAQHGENLVPGLLANKDTAEWLEKEAKRLVRAIKRDDESRDDWKKARADEYKLYAGVVEAMKAGGNAPHDTLGTRIILQLWSRGCDQVVPQKGNIIQVQPNRPDDVQAAADRERYMNWQLRHKVPFWIQSIRMSYLRWLITGSEFRYKMWDPVLKTTRIEDISADDVIVPYSRKDVDPFMGEVPRVTLIRRWHRWTLEDYGLSGMLDKDQVTKLYDKETESVDRDDGDDTAIEEVGIQIDKVEKPDMTAEDRELEARKVYVCQTWTKLPDGDRMRPTLWTIDRKTSLPLALMAREDEDPFDRMRFEREKKAWDLQAKNVAAQFQQMVQQGVPAEQPPPPPMPAPPRMRPIYSFLHYRLFPNPAGFYGIGVGYLLKNNNLMTDKLMAEYLLSARYQNMQGGFLPEGSAGKTGPVEMEMGKFHTLHLEAEQMNGIKPFVMHPPSDGLWKFIGKLNADSSTLIADADTLSGEAGPTNETKAAAEQRNYNATQLVSTITGLFTETLAYEIRLIADDNRNFMPDMEDFYPDDGQGMQTAHRADWTDEFRFTFTADQRMQTKPERIQAATATLQQLNATPAIVQDPNRGPQVIYAATLEYFKAIEKPDLERALGQPPPPPQPTPPPQLMSQEDENAGFINEQDHPVLPEDPHADHYGKMQEFKVTDYYANLSPSGKAMFDKHERGHIAELYKADAARANAERMGTRPGMGGGPGNVGLPGTPGPAPGGPIAPPGGGGGPVGFA